MIQRPNPPIPGHRLKHRRHFAHWSRPSVNRYGLPPSTSARCPSCRKP